MTGEDLWVGIDLGTQSVRALAVDGSGAVAGRGREPLHSTREGDRHEQDSGQWWEAAAAACRGALEGLDSARVRGVAVDGTSGTVLLVDRAGEPVTPALMYDDARAAEQAERANEAGEEVWSALGYRMQANWGLPKLLWLLEERADPSGLRLSHQPDVITRRLAGGDVPTDTSHALKSGYDLLHDSWPREHLGRLGVPGEALPDVVLPGSALGEVSDEASRETGLPAGAAVVAGMTDSCASQLATGALGEGSWNSVLGTTLALKGVSRELVRDPNGVLYSHRSPDGGWLPGGASSAGAGVLAEELPDRDLDELTRRAARYEGTAPVAYPLVSRGERFPFAAAEAERFMLGEPADEAEHLAALFQGLTSVERLCFDYLDLLGAPVAGEISLTGGAASNRHLCGVRADVLGRPVRLLESAESAFGMAVLAASAGRPTAEVAAEMARVREVIEPGNDGFDRFRESYLALVEELERRGWLGEELAGHARTRAG